MDVSFTVSIPESTLPPGKAIYQNFNQVLVNTEHSSKMAEQVVIFIGTELKTDLNQLGFPLNELVCGK